MSFRTTVLLLSFVVSSLSQTALFTGQGDVVFDQPAYNTTFGPFNVHETASLTVSSTKLPVSVCIVHSPYGLPHWTQYNADNCVFYFNSSTNSFTENVAIRDEDYLIGVYLSSPESKKGDNTSVTVTLNGNDCGNQGFWDGNTCVAAPQISWGEVFTGDFVKGETKFWQFENPAHVGHFTVTTFEGFDISAENAEVWVRFNAGPSANENDGKDPNGNLTIASPRPGTWVIGIHAAEAGQGRFQLNGQTCDAFHGGVDCSIEVYNMTNDANIVLRPGESRYWRLVAQPEYPLIVSITTVNGSDIPHFFATKGVIPTAESFDIRNCNGAYCDVVRTISFNLTDVEEWYFAAFSVLDNANTTFGIWWNSTCVTGCVTDNHGTCLDDGRCECEIDFTGIDCSISKGLGPQYIVLIIIASLVVASAIIGFVAWAYMRRKRAAYEIVS